MKIIKQALRAYKRALKTCLGSSWWSGANADSTKKAYGKATQGLQGRPKQVLRGVLGLSLWWLSGLAYAVNDSPGGPAVNQLNFQPPVTKIAEQIYSLHTMMLIICLVIFLGVFGVMFYSIVVHRKSKGYKPANFHESTLVEIVWTVVPFVIITLMALPATKAIIDMKDTTNPDLTIKVTGYQWKWGYDYIQGPGAGVHLVSTLSTPRQVLRQKLAKREVSDTYLQEVDYPLVVPVNKKVRIITTAADVIHSWYVPAFAVKQDAFPGLVRDTWFKAEKVGTYRGFCAELCGKDHAFMPVVVQVVSEADYTKWAAATLRGEKFAIPESHAIVKTAEPIAPSKSTASQSYAMDELKTRGEAVYQSNCAVCHQANGKGMGPFPALDGGAVSNGPLAQHIQLVLHGKAQMPPWDRKLNNLDMAAVITYQRNVWGNHTGDVVQPAQIEAVRTGKDQVLQSASDSAKRKE